MVTVDPVAPSSCVTSVAVGSTEPGVTGTPRNFWTKNVGGRTAQKGH
jgi:hypothetical protein